jgi:hypothetical protein
MIDPVSVSFALTGLYEVIKFWVPLITGAWAVFTGATWVKNKFVIMSDTVQVVNNNLTELKHEVVEQTNKFVNVVNNQTTAYVGEIKELRSDFRSFIAPQILANSFARNAPVKKPARKPLTTKAKSSKV